MSEALQIASLILHCRPERLPAVKANLALLDGLEIYQESPQGKLILVLEAEREEQILDTLGQFAEPARSAQRRAGLPRDPARRR